MHVIYVDDERPALENFRLTVENFADVDSLHLFQTGSAALEWAAEHTVDVAFLDMELPDLHGLSLAKGLRKHNQYIRIIFVTAYSQYALEAWGVDAIGYVLKPYSAADIRKELNKAASFRPLAAHRVVIQTIPTFSVTVNGRGLHLSRTKSRELFALLVDRGGRGITTGEGIACLWPDRTNDTNTQSLFRMTYKRLVDALEEAGIGDIIISRENHRYIRVDQVECDLYRILSGDKEAAKKYAGSYLREYSWAEERNAQLFRMLIAED
ncbi:MAG: response regulator [Anaerotignum sp.]